MLYTPSQIAKKEILSTMCLQSIATQNHVNYKKRCEHKVPLNVLKSISSLAISNNKPHEAQAYMRYKPPEAPLQTSGQGSEESYASENLE